MASPKIFYVIDDLIQGWGGVPVNNQRNSHLLNEGKILPVPFNFCQPFTASVFLKPS